MSSKVIRFCVMDEIEIDLRRGGFLELVRGVQRRVTDYRVLGDRLVNVSYNVWND